MNRNLKFTFLAFAAFSLVAGAGFAATDNDDQVVTLTVNEVAEITAGADISLATASTVTPGATPANPTDSTSHLQYTSVVDAPNKRIIQAKLTGTVPAGTSLKLTASGADSGEGSPAAQITLSTSDQSLISNIGSVATGALATDGPALDYVWSIDNVQLLDTSTTANVTITFTLGEDA